jgi:hypothetical protein
VAAARAPETTSKSFCSPHVPTTGAASTLKKLVNFTDKQDLQFLQLLIAVQFVSDEWDVSPLKRPIVCDLYDIR